MSAYALPDLFLSPTSHFSFADEEKLNHESDDDENCINIAVNDAKIDSALLIKSLVVPSKDVSPKSQRRLRRIRPGCTESTSTSPPCAQDALKFELAISLNGRSYTALRSLPSFEELRKDLMEELEEDIPELHFEESVQGYSFSFLQGMLKSYIPTVERWLQVVTRRISTTKSTSLRSFLWEPMSMPEYLHDRDDSSSSLLSLVRIDETEFDESDDEEL